eukprot:258232_1
MQPLSLVNDLLDFIDAPREECKPNEEQKQPKHHGGHLHKKKKKKDEFNPAKFWCGDDSATKPYLFVSPMRFVMGDGVLDHIARYLSLVPSTNPGLIITQNGLDRFGPRLANIFKQNKSVNLSYLIFEGQCLFKGADQIMNTIKAKDVQNIDCILSMGGGKIIDVGKLVAKQLNVPTVSIPTIASNEASCSALSIIHCSRRGFRGLLSYKSSPSMVIVDSGIIAKAPLKYFVAGIGDAMATFYETSICQKNPAATNCLGGRICLSTLAMATVCKDTLFEYAVKACDDIDNQRVTVELDKCIEANTLLSGIGFESGGIALAHAIAHSMTAGARKHKQFMHGEEVAVGLITQLMFQGEMDELKRMATLFATIGLPIMYKQLKLNILDDEDKELNQIFEVLFGDRLEFRNNQIGDVNKETVLSAMRDGEKYVESLLDDTAQKTFLKFHPV